jgi:hypothetical protein
MLKHLAAAAAIAMLMSSPAWANQCLADMAAIDAAMAAHPKLSAAQMESVTKERHEGEVQHNAGKHDESVATLAKAKATLGLH